MRRVILIATAVVGVIVIVTGAIVLYAVINLNSIIAERRQTILDKVSVALGREVHADDIKASVGWGVMADLTGVRIGDDPAISQKPFVEASDVYAKLQLMPLLSRRLEITEVTLDKPVIRIVQTRDGRLNVSTIGQKKGGPEAARETGKEKKDRAAGSSSLGSLSVKDFSVNNGTLIFQQEGGAEAASFNAIDLSVKDFDFTSPISIKLTFAALSDQQNFKLAASIGPLLKNGELDLQAIPLSARLKAGPIAISRLKAIPMLAKSIPQQLSIPDPVSFTADAAGTFEAIKFHLSSDLSASRVAYGDAFDKPAGETLKVSAEGWRRGSAIDVQHADLTLGDLVMKATNLKVGGGRTSARIDTNNFDIASLGKILLAIGKNGLSGKSEIHSDVALSGGKPSANGTVALADVAMTAPDSKSPGVSHVNGTVKLNGSSADAGPITFKLGGSQATLKSHIDQFQPLVASYQLNAAAVHLADLAPSRPQDEQINDLSAAGSAALKPSGPVIDSKITSGSGNLAGMPYQSLSLNVSLEGKRARVTSLRFNAFAGEITASAETRLIAHAPFSASMSFSNLDIQKILDAQKSKAAGTLRGTLGGQMNVSAVAGPFDEMKPTMKGNGKLNIVSGKLIGVNIGGSALEKVQNLPGIGDLVPAAVIARHPELFSNPDTDIQAASLSYVLAGPRITSHDIKVQTADYMLLGDGWFDTDKNIDLGAHITLSQAFSKELIDQKKQVAYIADRDGQIDLPLQITGQLPKPSVLPNVTILAQRAGTHAMQEQGQKYIGKFLDKNLGKKGLPGGLGGALGGLLGGGAPDNGSGDTGGGSGGSGAPADGSKPAPNPKSSPNPLDQLKKFF